MVLFRRQKHGCLQQCLHTSKTDVEDGIEDGHGRHEGRAIHLWIFWTDEILEFELEVAFDEFLRANEIQTARARNIAGTSADLA